MPTFLDIADADSDRLLDGVSLLSTWRGETDEALHPGGVDTPIFRHAPELLMKLIRPTLTTPEKAARLPTQLALDPALDGVTGGYFDAKGPAARSPRARNKKVAERLYQDSMALLGINPL